MTYFPFGFFDEQRSGSDASAKNQIRVRLISREDNRYSMDVSISQPGKGSRLPFNLPEAELADSRY